MQSCLATMFFNVMQNGYETFQNVALILYSVIRPEINATSITNKRLLQKERGSYKFTLSFEAVIFYCRKILRLTVLSYMWSFMFFKLLEKYTYSLINL